MKPPFAYYGGKQKIAKYIVPLIPEHDLYVEPFSGGGTILFAKDERFQTKNSYNEVLNDTNTELYNFFIQLRDNGDKLCELLTIAPFSEDLHREAKAYAGDDELMRAYYFYICIEQSFSHIYKDSWARSRDAHKGPIIFKSKCNRLFDYVERLQRVHISNEDALKCIKRWDKESVFFYCDPPYPNTDQGAYGGYTQKNFNELLEVLDSIKGQFILSCYPNEVVPKGWKKIEIETKMSCCRTRGKIDARRTECLWTKGDCFDSVLNPAHEQLELFL